MVKPKATLLGLLAIAATGATGGLGRRLSHRNVNRVVGLAYGKKASHACPSLADRSQLCRDGVAGRVGPQCLAMSMSPCEVCHSPVVGRLACKLTNRSWRRNSERRCSLSI